MITSGRALSIADDQSRRRGDALRRVLDRDRVGRGDRRDLPDVDHDAQQVDILLDVRVAQVERPDDRSSYSRRLAGVSGTIVIVRGAVTR